MSSFELNDSNTFKVDGIHIEIWEPNLIVLPVPNTTENANISLQITICITNNALSSFPFFCDKLSPEILASSGQVIHPQKLINAQITPSIDNSIAIPSKKTLLCYLIAKLSIQNNLFQLQWNICTSFQFSTNTHHTWYLDTFQLGIYQLRLIYNSPSGELIVKDRQTGDNILLESYLIDPIITTFVNVQFVEPVETDRKAVEVNGIRFETIVPENIWRISLSNLFEVSPSVEIGIRITNNSSISERFCSYTTLIPVLLGENGLILGQQLGGGSTGWVGSKESDYHLVKPQESVTFFVTAHIEGRTDGLLNLIVNGTGYGYWSLEGLKLGIYQLQLTYRALTNPPDGGLFEDLWKGMVHTPFVEFCLIQS
ncbi:hypothetical protein BV372_10780 [Nostoc sp. T09]|uniref:hypothetical protein n=1 Tax=Nostoc sp. T09 TaxID=1932621 RepID=UPI000A3CAC58|nr:hypothetical protein [Nostoc sp. T09]OUL35527.1 hypothetical protein BV372_10780 [Nostoc sp. T09]